MNDPEPLSWAELDQLADWTEGLLTGPDAAHITHLITTDRRWTTAHHDLTHAQPTLHTALHTAANAIHPGPLPPDIAHRINHTLTHLDTPARARRTQRRMHPGSRPPGRPRNGRRRAALVGVATVLVLLGAAGGIGALLRYGAAQSNEDTAAAPADAEATGGSPLPTVGASGRGEGAAALIVASGTDYSADTLRLVAQPPPTSRFALDAPQLSAGAGLAALATTAGFGACVDAVLGRHPGQVVLADFARYDGSPAVILRIGQQAGSLAVAVGPECGRDDDPHELAVVALP